MNAPSAARSVRIERVEVTTACEVGATHRQRQRDCQDAVGWRGAAAGSSVVATVAIADGHSDRRCVRSRAGADFVVAAATEMPDDTVLPAAITEALVADWRRRVDAHLAAHPLTGADIGNGTLEPDELSAAWASNARVAYGTTAALCRITSEAITIVRVGDGDIIAVAADGQARRLAVTESAPSELTESISQPDALRIARSAEIAADSAPVLLMLATDGFDNAYPAADSMLRAASELAALRRDTGRPIGADVLSQWAREAADVSGDDATVAAVWIETAPWDLRAGATR